MVNTQQLKEYIKSLGADLVGIADADTLANAPEGHGPKDYLFKARSIISYASVLNKGAILSLPKSRNEYILEFDQANAALNRIGHLGARFLEEKGYTSIAFPATDSIGDAARLKGDLSHKHAAVAAGIGLFGANNIIVTPQYGCRIRLGTIITEAPLEPDKKLAENPCLHCGKCIKACPSGALGSWKDEYDQEQGWNIDKEKCYHYIFVQLGGKRCGVCIASCPLCV